jgi:hypothetical protein
MTRTYFRLATFVAGLLAFAIPALAQKSKPRPTPKRSKTIVFAVLSDGKMLEPIAYVNGGKLEPPVNGSDDSAIISTFNRTYYKPGTAYRLVFGGADAGSVKVKSSDVKAECSRNMAQVITTGAKTPLRGLVMGLATNAPIKSLTGFRRKPTAAEKDEIETLVRAEFARQKLTPQGVLRYHNFTALDLENDGKPEFVGTYWVEIDKLTRGLLFFIAGRGNNDKYSLGFSEYRLIDQAGVMSREIKDVDQGVYHELLLDTFDYDSDGTSNIFTYVQSFEGAGFNAYSRSGGKWVRSFEGSNYHCGY